MNTGLFRHDAQILMFTDSTVNWQENGCHDDDDDDEMTENLMMSSKDFIWVQ